MTVPNWERIAADEVWQEEIGPMIEMLRDKALIALMNARGDDIPFLQGKARAYNELLSIPAEEVRRLALERAEIAKQQGDQEEEDGPGRRDTNRIRRWIERKRATGR